MAKLKYVGDVKSRVRSNGEKIIIQPNKSFTCTEAEAKQHLTGPYKKYFEIVELDDKELVEKAEAEKKKKEETAKTQTEEFKEAEAKRLEEEKKAKEETAKKEEEESTINKVDEFKNKIELAESIDALNTVSTDIANDEELEENEELATLIEEKMAKFINPQE